MILPLSFHYVIVQAALLAGFALTALAEFQVPPNSPLVFKVPIWIRNNSFITPTFTMQCVTFPPNRAYFMYWQFAPLLLLLFACATQRLCQVMPRPVLYSCASVLLDMFVVFLLCSQFGGRALRFEGRMDQWSFFLDCSFRGQHHFLIMSVGCL